MNIPGPSSSTPMSTPASKPSVTPSSVSTGPKNALATDIKVLNAMVRPMEDAVTGRNLKSLSAPREGTTEETLERFEGSYSLEKPSSNTYIKQGNWMLGLDLADEQLLFKFLDWAGKDIKWIRICSGFYAKHGIEAVDNILARGHKIFLDLRLNTAQEGSHNSLLKLQGRPINYLSIKLDGTEEQIHKFLAIKEQTLARTQLVIKSGTGHAKRFIANNTAIEETQSKFIQRLSTLLEATSIKGLLCSSEEISSYRQNLPSKIELFVLSGLALTETPSTITPAHACSLGASYAILMASKLLKGKASHILASIKGLNEQVNQ